MDYKKELGFGFGGRTRFTLDTRLGGKNLRIIVGGEYQRSMTNAQNFGNRQGAADTIRFTDQLVSTQGFLFQQAELDLTDDLLLIK